MSCRCVIEVPEPLQGYTFTASPSYEEMRLFSPLIECDRGSMEAARRLEDVSLAHVSTAFTERILLAINDAVGPSKKKASSASRLCWVSSQFFPINNHLDHICLAHYHFS